MEFLIGQKHLHSFLLLSSCADLDAVGQIHSVRRFHGAAFLVIPGCQRVDVLQHLAFLVLVQLGNTFKNFLLVESVFIWVNLLSNFLINPGNETMRFLDLWALHRSEAPRGKS